MNLKDFPHVPVMLKEALTYLAPRDGQTYLDATFGAGCYSQAILNSCDCKVFAIDQDPEVEAYSQLLKKKFSDRFRFLRSNFANYNERLKDEKFDGVVADIGISSMQLDLGARGFSFTHDGPLDMRMSKTGFSAADFINSASKSEIADVIYNYGDERASRRIAQAIEIERAISPITSTLRLANIVRGALKNKGKIDAATKTFQAIRIHINNELENLETFLKNLKNVTKRGARIVIVSFHSLEDRIVKNFFKDNSPQKKARSKYFKDDVKSASETKIFQAICKKAILPSLREIRLNPRARSAKLRWAISEGNHEN